MLPARSSRTISGVLPAAKILVAVLVLAPTTSCWLGDSALGPDAWVAHVTIAPVFTDHVLGPLGEVGRLGFIVRREDGTVIVGDTVDVDIENRRVEYAVDVTYDPPSQTVTVELILFGSNGGILFTGGPTAYTLSDAADPEPVEVPVVFVGPRGTVRGSVSVDGIGFDDVTVSLVSDITVSTTTAGDGAYVFLDVWAGTYNVDVSGFPTEFEFPTAPLSATVSTDGQVVDVDFVGNVAPVLVLSPATMSFSAAEGGLNPSSQTLEVSNGGAGTLSWSVSEAEPWLSLSPGSGSATTETDIVTVSVDISGLTAGPYNATITAVGEAPANASPQTTEVTLTVAPPDGGDLVVFNDISIFDNTGMDIGAGNPNNHILVQNLVGFSSSAPRGSGTKVWWDIGRGSRCEILPLPSKCTPASYSSAASEIVTAGFTNETVFSASGTLTDIPADVKVIFLWNPTVVYTVAEINALKQFAVEGGRIIFVGEHSGFYGPWIPVENQFLMDMGAEMVSVADAVDCDYVDLPAASLRSHQITNGMSAFRVACSSVIQPGPNDFAFLFDSSNTKVLGGVAKFDVTPLLPGAPAPSARLRGEGSGLDEPTSDDPTGSALADPTNFRRR